MRVILLKQGKGEAPISAEFTRNQVDSLKVNESSYGVGFGSY